MKIITITIKAAFQDGFGHGADAVAEQLVSHLRDGFGAEVTYTTKRDERSVPYPDPDESWTDRQLQRWQDQAHDEMERD